MFTHPSHVWPCPHSPALLDHTHSTSSRQDRFVVYSAADMPLLGGTLPRFPLAKIPHEFVGVPDVLVQIPMPDPVVRQGGGGDERGQGMHGCRVPCPDPIIREMGEEAPHHLQGGLPGLSACSYIHPFFPSSLFFTTTLFILPAGRTPTLVRRPRTSHIHTSATALCPSSSSYPICTTLQRSVWSDMNVVHTHCIVV